MNPLTRLPGYARPYRGLMMLAFIGMVMYAAVSTGLALIIKPIADKPLPSQVQLAFLAFGGRPGTAPAIWHGHAKHLPP